MNNFLLWTCSTCTTLSLSEGIYFAFAAVHHQTLVPETVQRARRITGDMDHGSFTIKKKGREGGKDDNDYALFLTI